MNKMDMIEYWIETSDRDYETMINLSNCGDYHWSLFIGHLVIEKLLKALYIKNNDNTINPPKTHDLTLLAEKSGIETNESIKDTLDRITAFNISARYPDYKQEFYRKCTREFALSEIKKIQEMRIWLKKLLATT
jgi:HEPN domain-containing protein